MSLLLANRASIRPSVALLSVPTFILIGDSNADGRLSVNPSSTTYAYYSEYANDIYNAQKSNVKIFDNIGGSDLFVTLNIANAQVQNASYNCGFEQVTMWELSNYYGSQEIRIIKLGYGGTTAYNSWQSGQSLMNGFETAYSDAVIAAGNEGLSLDIVGIITFIGTNDAVYDYMANAFEVNMTAIINHLRTTVIGSSVPIFQTAATDGQPYNSTVRAAQISIAATLSDVYYIKLYESDPGQVHPGFSGVFDGSMKIANSILVNALTQPSIEEKYNLNFQTNASGNYTLRIFIYGPSIGYIIDWGDGSTTEVTANDTNYTHSYADASTKTININTYTPWAIYKLNINNAVGSKIVGEFDMSQLTGLLGTFNTSANNTDLTSIVPPIPNFNYDPMMGSLLLNNSGLTSIDFTRFGGMTNGSCVFSNNASLTTFTDNSSNKVLPYGLSFTNNDALAYLDISAWIGTSGGSFYVRQCSLLETVTLSPSLGNHSAVLMDLNPILSNIVNYEGLLTTTVVEFDGDDLTLALVDAMINYIWSKSQTDSVYRAIANKAYNFTGNNGASGTFDATTDWSGGLPTSPQAKRYDLLNDITDTYNFTTFSV